MKLSDPKYHLPTIEPLSAFELFDKGTTAPMGVGGVDMHSGERGHYVVKFKNTGRMSTTSSAFELIGAWMAMELDLPVVKPVLVNITSEFVETALRGREGYRAALQSQGINSGSVYQAGLSPLPTTSFILPNELLEVAKLIYVFDMFIANADRGHVRANVASNGTDLVIYDHEMAFSFCRIMSFARNPTPWNLNEADRDLYQRHFFYTTLRELKPDLTQHVSLLQRFNSSFWEKVYATLPPDWINTEVREIGPYLASIVENHAYFAESINQTLAA